MSFLKRNEPPGKNFGLLVLMPGVLEGSHVVMVGAILPLAWDLTVHLYIFARGTSKSSRISLPYPIDQTPIDKRRIQKLNTHLLLLVQGYGRGVC